MIESKYKIEYVLQDDENKKSSPFKMLWYLLLLSIVLLTVFAITYDFSIKSMMRDSSQLAKKVKVHVFNLEDIKQPQKPQIDKNSIAAKILTPKPKKVNAATKPVAIKSDQHKKIISNLTEKQQTQLKKIEEEISKNNELTINLNSLSTKLVLEKNKNDSLSTKLSEQEEQRLKLEKQLNQLLTDSKNGEVVLENFTTKAPEAVTITTPELVNNKVSNIKTEPEILGNTITQKPEATTITEEPKVEKQNTVEVKIEEVEVVKAPEINIENAPTIKVETETVVAVEEKPIEVKPTTEPTSETNTTTNTLEVSEQSATDKIIEAMSSINSNDAEVLNKAENETKPVVSEPETEVSEPVVSEIATSESANKTIMEVKKETLEDVVFSIGFDDKSEKPVLEAAANTPTTENQVKAIEVETTEKIIADSTETNKQDAEKVDEKEASSASNQSDAKSEKELVVKEEPQQPVSSVDAIIAAMEASQPKNDSADNIDPELEKEINQQLVEQGDLSIDN